MAGTYGAHHVDDCLTIQSHVDNPCRVNEVPWIVGGAFGVLGDQIQQCCKLQPKI